MPTLGDFFKSAPHALPVNPKPITFTAIARGPVLPGGGANPGFKTGGLRTRVTGAFAFVGNNMQATRFDARTSLLERFKDPKTGIYPYIEERDVELEIVYQMFWRVVHEWRPENKEIGERLFPSVDLVRELVEWDECNRVMGEYFKYAKDEHPEVGVSPETFREVQGGRPSSTGA